MKKSALFCSHGLGDGLLFLTLANNLKQNGFAVTAYHDFLGEIQDCLEVLVQKFPPEEELAGLISSLDLIVINGDSSPRSQKLAALAKTLKPASSWVLHATTCKGKVAELPGDYYLDSRRSLVDNLLVFSREVLGLKKVVRDNCLRLPKEKLLPEALKEAAVKVKKNFFKQPLAALHAVSKDAEKNWPLKKFLCLAQKLEQRGYAVAFLFSREERTKWAGPIEKAGFFVPALASLREMVFFLHQAAFFIGNDSGLGHLAAALKVPVLSIFSTRRKEKFWRPERQIGRSVVPFLLLPNCKGFRLQEKFWKFLLPVFKVLSSFRLLEKSVFPEAALKKRLLWLKALRVFHE
ncbi:MAG: glycosyltransferase family 9 protein [Parachlamydiales bacterium]|jgi:hypothetical protein